MGSLSIRLVAWHARMPGATCAHWLPSGDLPEEWMDAAAPMRHLSMMAGRRLGIGDRLVVDSTLSLLADHSTDALVLCSRHGELERNDRIMRALAVQAPVSPTDFTMSVHNAAAGTCTIVAGQPLVSTSLSAGVDTFQQAFFEVVSLFQAGYQRVLLADFEGPIPAFYQDQVGVRLAVSPYAVCLLLEAGTQWSCQASRLSAAADDGAYIEGSNLPQSLHWLQAVVSGQTQFVVPGQSHTWHWKRMT